MFNSLRPMGCSLPGSSVHGISQARILEWIAICFSKGSSWPRDRTHFSCLAGRFFTTQPPREPQLTSYLTVKDWLLPWWVSRIRSDEIRSVAQSCPTLCDPMNRSRPGLPVQHHLPEFTQTHVHWVGDAIQPSHPLSSPFPSTPNSSQHQNLFQRINSSHEVAKVLEFQL